MFSDFILLVLSTDVRLRSSWVSEIRIRDFSKIVNLRMWRHVSFVYVLGCDCGPKQTHLYRLVYLFTTILSSEIPHRIYVSFKPQPEHIFKVGIYRRRNAHHLINWTAECLWAHPSNPSNYPSNISAYIYIYIHIKPNHNWNQSFIPSVDTDIGNILEGEN